jgi:membrane associated rhomboid family serine protease
MPDPETTPPPTTTTRSRLSNTYAGYSIGCAAVWAAVLAMGRGVLDAKNWDMLRLGAAGWWAGWLSATIARVGYPPPHKLTEAGQRRLEKVSLVLVLLGFINFFRLLITGRRRAGGPEVGSS